MHIILLANFTLEVFHLVLKSVREYACTHIVCVCVFEIGGGGFGWLGGLVSAALGCGFLGINAGLFPTRHCHWAHYGMLCTCDS